MTSCRYAGHYYREGGCVAVSDGSALEGKAGTAAWCLSSGMLMELISAGFRVPGPSFSQCSYRSELAGIHAIMKVVHRVTRFFYIQEGTIEVGTDSLSVIDRLFGSLQPACLADHSYDLLAECQKMMAEIPQITWKWRHIPGHQDRKNQHIPMDIWAERNILMDARATIVYEAIPEENKPIFLATAIQPLLINGVPIVANFQDHVRKATVGKGILDYWKHRGKVGQGTSDDIAWKSFDLARESLPTKRQHWLVKQYSDTCAVGKVMKYRKEWTHSRCPRCKTPVETSSHVWTCPDQGAQDIWSEAIDSLRVWLASQQTNMAVTDAICDRLKSWSSNTPFLPLESRLLGLQSAIEAQDIIGWHSAVEGRWSVKWEIIQDRHFKNNSLKRTGRRWLAAIIRKLWITAWDLWEHRNGVQQEVKKAARRAANRVIIQDEYGQGTIGLEGYDACLFNKPLLVRLSETLDKQDAWIRRIQSARIRAADNIPRRRQQAMDNLRLLLARLGHQPRIQSQPTTE